MSQPTSRLGTRRGFSLLELIVVIGVMGVVTSLGATTFVRMMDYWAAERGRVELERRAEYALDQMRQDFAAALSSNLSGAALFGESRVARQEDLYFGHDLADDQVFIPVQLPQASPGLVGAGLIRYVIDRTEGHNLLRRTGELDEAIPSVGVNVAEGVLKMRVEYSAGDGAWVSDWTDQTSPRAVRVTLVLADPNRPAVQLSRKAVFPIRVG